LNTEFFTDGFNAVTGVVSAELNFLIYTVFAAIAVDEMF